MTSAHPDHPPLEKIARRNMKSSVRHWKKLADSRPKRCCGGFLKNSDFNGGSEFGNPYFPGTSFPPLKISNGRSLAGDGRESPIRH